VQHWMHGRKQMTAEQTAWLRALRAAHESMPAPVRIRQRIRGGK